MKHKQNAIYYLEKSPGDCKGLAAQRGTSNEKVEFAQVSTT